MGPKNSILDVNFVIFKLKAKTHKGTDYSCNLPFIIEKDDRVIA
jgi:hypothetical protein